VKIGYNTNGFLFHRLFEALELIAEKGFEVVALSVDIPHIDPFNISNRDIEKIGSKLDNLGLIPILETGGRFVLDPKRKHRPNLIEKRREDREKRIGYLKRCIDIAEMVGARTVVFFSGVLPDGVSKEQAKRFLEQGIFLLHEYAKGKNVRLALEPEPGHLIERINDFKSLSKQIQGVDLGLCMDIGHIEVLGEGNIKKILNGLSINRILQVHIEDAVFGKHIHLEPGEGNIDFLEVFKELKEVGYSGPVCWELSRSCHNAPDAMNLAWDVWEKIKKKLNL